jgi:hypothetical protein
MLHATQASIRTIGTQEARSKTRRAMKQLGARINQMNAFWIRISTFGEVVRGAQADDATAKNNNVAGVLPAGTLDLAWHAELNAGQAEGQRNSKTDKSTPPSTKPRAMTPLSMPASSLVQGRRPNGVSHHSIIIMCWIMFLPTPNTKHRTSCSAHLR